MTRDGDAFPRDCNQVVREQGFLPAGALDVLTRWSFGLSGGQVSLAENLPAE